MFLTGFMIGLLLSPEYDYTCLRNVAELCRVARRYAPDCGTLLPIISSPFRNIEIKVHRTVCAVKCGRKLPTFQTDLLSQFFIVEE
jgi:hypothetical protein